MSQISVMCPHCGGTEFAENSVAPVCADIHQWTLREGLPHPDSYGNSTTLFEAETLDANPYECTSCNHSFTAERLIVEPKPSQA